MKITKYPQYMPNKSTDAGIISLQTLEILGLSPKEIDVYLAVLQLGSAPLRKIAEFCQLKRGTVYDALKRLQSVGLIGFLDGQKHRYFTAEHPRRLQSLITQKEVATQEARQNLAQKLPVLEALMGQSEYRPNVHYYEAAVGVRNLLEDVLSETSTTRNKLYRVYSSSDLRDLIANSWPSFNKARKAKGIRVRAIAIGEGGSTHGLDERKWLSTSDSAPMYTIVYANKVAFIGLDDRKQLFGVVVNDKAISDTQRLIFDSLWQSIS
jgi:hypothetical protein